MKKIFKVFAVFAAASALLACNKETLVEETNTEPGVVQFSAGPITKTVFGTPGASTIPTLWTNTHKVALSLNLASTKQSTDPVVGGGGTTASFSAEISDDSSGDYNFYAVSPYNAVQSVNSTYKSFLINFPTAQTPSATSPDELAQILYAKTAAGSTFPTTSVNLSFSHLSAYGKIGELKNLALDGGETVQSISLTADENWAGRYYYYAEDYSTFSAGDFQENSASSTITINTSSTTDIWFGCAPVDLGGKHVDVVVTTNLGTFSKTITIPAGKKFEPGKVAVFNIDMNGITRASLENYTLVDDISDLTVGSEVIIVAKDYNFAMSTTQNSNNRGQAGVTKSGTTISSPAADVQVFTIANGTQTGTYAFSTGSGYIYAASSSSNWLRTEGSLSDNSSWNISIAGDGEATVQAVGTNTRNTLQYNSGSSIFSCYGSANQAAVTIYKKNSGPITCATPVITGAGTSFTITCATAGATIYYETSTTDMASVATPTTSSNVYSSAVAITATTYVKAYAVKAGCTDSAVASETCVYSSLSPETITFSTLGLSNATQYSDPFDGGHFTITFGGGANDGKYYTTGSGIRTYGGGTITIASTSKIAQIDFTWDGDNKPTADVASPTGYNFSTSKWTGSANSVVLTRPSGSGHWRLQSVTVTYE